MAAKKENKVMETPVELRRMKLEKAVVRIEGDSPLIIHQWSEKAQKEILDKQMGVKKAEKKALKNPVGDFIESMYWITPMPEELTEEAFEKAVKAGARWGFPATAFKQAMQSTAYRCGWETNQMGLRGGLFIEPDAGDLVEIKGCVPVMREDMVKVGMGTADIRYRGEFREWYADLKLTFDSELYPLDYLVNILNAAGFKCGIGEWRVERDGQFGMFHVAG